MIFILENFAKHFFEQSPGPLKHRDAAFVLSFSVILLNTDAHNPLVLRKMTCEEFIRNNRGINAGESLPEEYLKTLYDSIIMNEIQLLPAGDLKSLQPDGTRIKYLFLLYKVSQPQLQIGIVLSRALNKMNFIPLLHINMVEK